MECDKCGGVMPDDTEVQAGKVPVCDSCHQRLELVGPWRRKAGFSLVGGFVSFLTPIGTIFAIGFGFQAVTYVDGLEDEQSEQIEGENWPTYLGYIGIVLGLIGLYVSLSGVSIPGAMA